MTARPLLRPSATGATVACDLNEVTGRRGSLVVHDEFAPPEQIFNRKGTDMVTNDKTNANDELVAKVRAHVEARVTLLASCSRNANALNNSATAWAYAELRAIAEGLTDRDAVQRAVCEKFPKVTGNGKVSKTPNSAFKTSFDKFVLLADVLAGEHKTYTSDNALRLATEFVSDDNARASGGYRMTLNDVVDRIKSDHAAAAREERANESEADKAARKAREAAEGNAVVAGIVVNDGAVMLALAERIANLEPEQAVAFIEPLRKLMEACEGAVTVALATTAEAEAEKLAA